MQDLQRYLVEEFAEEYLEGKLPRRELFRRVILMTGSVAVSASALSALGVRGKSAIAAERPPEHIVRPLPSQAPYDPVTLHGTLPPAAQTSDNVVSPDDPDIVAGPVTFGGAAGDVFGYLAQPSGAGVYPGLIVIHENRGLVEPNMDITRRYAKEGYAALAVDLGSRAGGTAAHVDDPAQVTGFIGRANADDLVSDLLSGLDYLAAQQGVDAGRLGATGFCFGGGLTWRLTMAAANLKAAVPFYGSNPPLDNVPNIRASILAFYGQLDTRITDASTQMDAALDAAGKTHQKWIAPNANHAFFNNSASSYNPAAAMEAWQRALSWFAAYL